MYKSKLQELCQKEKWGLPKYTCMRDGADHCPQFKASVVVRGIAFDSPAACNSSKQALNQVAQLAFLHFSSSEPSTETNHSKENELTITSEDESVKNCINLQEGFKNKLKMHSSFHENDPNSYKMLLHKLATNEGFFYPSYKTIRSNESNGLPFVCTVEVEGELFEGAAAESEKLAELNAAKAAYTSFIERKLFQPHYHETLARRLSSAAISDDREDATDGSPPSNLISDRGLGTDHEMRSYLLCNRVRVFTCMPNMALPEGVVVLPIGEDRWAAVALEFTNEKAV